VFRRELSQNMTTWKVPQIVFRKDTSIDRMLKIEEIIKKDK
jgi:ribosome-binding factor A